MRTINIVWVVYCLCCDVNIRSKTKIVIVDAWNKKSPRIDAKEYQKKERKNVNSLTSDCHLSAYVCFYARLDASVIQTERKKKWNEIIQSIESSMYSIYSKQMGLRCQSFSIVLVFYGRRHISFASFCSIRATHQWDARVYWITRRRTRYNVLCVCVSVCHKCEAKSFSLSSMRVHFVLEIFNVKTTHIDSVKNVNKMMEKHWTQFCLYMYLRRVHFFLFFFFSVVARHTSLSILSNFSYLQNTLSQRDSFKSITFRES